MSQRQTQQQQPRTTATTTANSQNQNNNSNQQNGTLLQPQSSSHFYDDSTGLGTALQSASQNYYQGAPAQDRGFARNGPNTNTNHNLPPVGPAQIQGGVIQQQHTSTSPQSYTVNVSQDMLSSQPGYNKNNQFTRHVLVKQPQGVEVTNNNTSSNNNAGDDSNLCAVCLTEPKQFCFMSCGHFCLCATN